MKWKKETPRKRQPSVQWHAARVAATATRRDALRQALRAATLEHNMAIMDLRKRVKA